MGILPSEDWRSSIQNALTIERCNGMIAVLSPAYLTSQYCRNELARADRLGIQIYPIILSPFADAQLPLEIERLQYVDFKEWRDDSVYQNKLTKLLNALKEKFPSQFVSLPDPEARYLTNLIAELEARQGVANYVELEGETTKVATRPLPLVDKETGYMVLLSKEETKTRKHKQIYLKKISEVAHIYPRFILTGSPGAGKTTVIRNMTLDLARRRLDQPRTLPIPLLAYLPQWQDNWSFEEFLRAKWSLDSNPLDLLEKGELCLYLDGLNEMGAEKLSKVRELRSWLSNSPTSSQIIITCRADDYNEDLSLGNLPAVNIKQLSESQIKQFAKRYLGKRAKSFLQQVLKDESDANTNKRGLSQLISNPYFLTAFMVIYNNTPNEELPKNSGTLFEKLVLALWTREEQKKSTNISFEVAESEFARIAFAMIDSDMPVEVSRDYALLFLRDKELLSVGQSASFLISQNNGVRFYHQLIQEYFAAIGLARVGISHIRLDKKPLRTSSSYPSKYKNKSFRGDIFADLFETFTTPEYRRSSKWDQVIVSLCGFTEHPADIIKKLARIDPLLAVDCLLSGVSVSLDEVIDGFIEATSDEDEALRKAALSALAKIGGEQAIPYLAKALEDEENEVSKLAANLLVQFRAPAISHLIDHLKRADERKVIFSIQALAALGAPVVPPLREIFVNETNIVTKIRACNVLGRIKHKDSNTILMSLLGSKEEELVKMSIKGLGNIGDPSSVPDLISFLDNVPKSSIELRTELVEALGNIKEPQVVPILIDLLKDESRELHSAALLALRKVGTPEALLPVKTFGLLDSRNSEAKKKAITKIYADYGIVGLIHGLRSRSYWEIAYKLVEVPDIDFEILLKMLNSDSHHVKAMIAYCIGERGDKKHEGELITLLDDDSSFVKGIAIDSLGKLKSELAIPQLVENLHDIRPVYSNSKKRVCDNAARALLKIGTKDALASLNRWALTMIDRRIADEQTTPLVVLEKVGNNDAVPRLAKILRYKKSLISNYARKALLGIGTPVALEVIEEFDKEFQQ